VATTDASDGPARDDPAGPTGSRARDHMANERTYLSWLRTALGVVALAVAVARFGTRGSSDTLVVVVMLVFAATVLGVGTFRFYQVSRDLELNRFHLSRVGPLVVALMLVVAAAILVPLSM
jgi:putative membrane protein